MNVRVVIINAVMFQALWFVAVQGSDVWALVATAFFFFIHAVFLIQDQKTWFAILLFGLVGWLVDSSIANLGIVHYHGSYDGLSVSIGPLWLLCLWFCFSSTVFLSLQWLSRYLWIAALLGLLIAPSSYLLGLKLSNSSITVSWFAYYLVEGIAWGLLLPAMLFISEKLKRRQQRVACYV